MGSRFSEGLAARDAAASAVFSVFVEKHAFDDAFAKAVETRALAPRDRGLARLIAMTVLRRRGELRAVIASFLQKPLPENQGRLEPILLGAAAQLLFLDTPPHAAISLAVDQCRNDRSARRFDKLANAVLRRVSERGRDILAGLNAVEDNIPDWMLARWVAAYGADQAATIALASLQEAPLDLSIRGAPEPWAERLGGIVLPTGTVRCAGDGRIEAMPGYDDGQWWVQDAAAALPARLLGDVRGLDVLDICAAPGGKTAQLAAAGARVTALDKSPGRMKRVAENMRRLGLEANLVVGDAIDFAPGRQFDAILVDAPCSATGTIRRHPDILHLKRPEDVTKLAAVQGAVLAAAARLLKPGGVLVYCTCSLEPEEGVQQVDAFLRANTAFRRHPVVARDIASDAAFAAELITVAGDLRTLPSQFSQFPSDMTGCDGFYAARLRRLAD